MKNDYESAFKDFEQAKELDPESQGLIEAEIKKAKRAEKDFDKA